MPASPGRSAWDYLAGRAAGHRDWAYAEFGDNQWYHAWRMVVDRDWKYIFDQTAGDRLIARANDPFEEGNRIADPDCLEILAARRRNLVQSMTASLMPPYSSFYADGK